MQDEKLTKHQRYELFLAAVASFGGIATILIGILSYVTVQWQESQKDIDELKSRVWEKRWIVYSKIAQEAATIAITCNADREKESDRFRIYQQATRAFRQAYWGEMSLIEDVGVETAMRIYGIAVDSWESKNPKLDKLTPDVMQDLSWYMAHVFRESLKKTWNPQGAFDPNIYVKRPLHLMYNRASKAGLDVKAFEERLKPYEPEE